MSEQRMWSRWPLLLAVVTMLGCASGRASKVTYHDPNMDFSLAQTVAVLPFANLTPNPNAADRTRDVFMTMLQAGGGLYVLPPGEVARGSARANVANPIAPTSEEAVALAKIVQADVVITGTVLEYGEVRSGSTSSNVISVSLKMLEAQSGKVVWTASSTQGGVTASARLFGGGGQPMDEVTEKAVEDLLDKLFKKK
ncbi:MAG: DUF799 family lipoprotein [Acidobacteriota bacterium]